MIKFQILISIVFIFFITVSIAGDEDKSVKYSKSITAEDLKVHLKIIASNSFQGRETGKRGLTMAASYISHYFGSLNLPKIGTRASYYQEFTLLEEEWGEMKFSINDKAYGFKKDYYAFHRTASPGSILANEVIFLGYGIEDESYNDYLDQEVKDKIIMIFQGEPVDADGNCKKEWCKSCTYSSR